MRSAWVTRPIAIVKSFATAAMVARSTTAGVMLSVSVVIAAPAERVRDRLVEPLGDATGLVYRFLERHRRVERPDLRATAVSIVEVRGPGRDDVRMIRCLVPLPGLPEDRAEV